MATLDTSSVKASFAQLKAALKAILEAMPGVGKVWNRIRYANDAGEWLQIAAIEKVGGGQVLRAAFIYLVGFTDSRQGVNVTISPTFAIEIIQGFEDGTDEANSTATFEGFLADLLDHFIRDLYLGFTDGTEVTHSGLQAGEGDGRPEYVDAILAHRKVATITLSYTVCNKGGG